ncbi:glycosyltransferase family 4 protein [Bacteroidales bacterium MB20-C3-3]|nr:glycosyltransferase family 4 protein [Bacteroidales bacterium MB20-C3-3]
MYKKLTITIWNIHILHLIKTSQGASWALNLIKEITILKPEITFSVAIPIGGIHTKEYKKICRNVYQLNYSIDVNIFNQGKKLKEIVEIDKPDIIHSWFAHTTLYARLFLRNSKTPRLFEVVGPLHLETFLYRFFDVKSAQNNDYWKATTKYTYNKYLKSGVLPQKLFLNYIWIDLDKVMEFEKSSPILNIRKQYCIPDHIKIIGTASNMYPPKLFNKKGVKNHETLLKVFKRVLEKRDDVVLIIGGKAYGENKNYEEKLKKKANKISKTKIIFTGFVPNLGRLITEFDVFVFLSLSENLGGVYESLLFKVPTVASNRGGIPELVIDNITGYTCDLNSIDKIVEKIEILLDNHEIGSHFREEGYKRVFDILDKEKSIATSIDIYYELHNDKN